jgi:hypothetical protein
MTPDWASMKPAVAGDGHVVDFVLAAGDARLAASYEPR